MASQLNQLVARERSAEFARQAERARLAAASEATAPARRGGLLARLKTRRRPALTHVPTQGCTDGAVQ